MNIIKAPKVHTLPDILTLSEVELSLFKVGVSSSHSRRQHVAKRGAMTDLSLIAEQEWNEARRRAVILRPLVEFKHCPRNKAHEAAVELGLS